MSHPHTRLLLAERDSLLPLLRATPEDAFNRATVCTEWSVLDVIAHCASALVRVANGTAHSFSPADNQVDVDQRKAWPLDDVLNELEHGYELAAAAKSADGVALGEWVHGGDIREALAEPDAYASAGIEDALTILVTRSVGYGVPPTDVQLADDMERGLETANLRLGDQQGPAVGRLDTDIAGLFRLVANRRPELSKHTLEGVEPEALRVFF
ncbi:MAG: maleylpyruvate isomerase family mycothiol-dependent enzyme [Nocardioidaceae bacterium]